MGIPADVLEWLPASSFVEHFHAERNHQGVGNQLIGPGEEAARMSGEVVWCAANAWAGCCGTTTAKRRELRGQTTSALHDQVGMVQSAVRAQRRNEREKRSSRFASG